MSFCCFHDSDDEQSNRDPQADLDVSTIPFRPNDTVSVEYLKYITDFKVPNSFGRLKFDVQCWQQFQC